MRLPVVLVSVAVGLSGCKSADKKPIRTEMHGIPLEIGQTVTSALPLVQKKFITGLDNNYPNAWVVYCREDINRRMGILWYKNSQLTAVHTILSASCDANEQESRNKLARSVQDGLSLIRKVSGNVCSVAEPERGSTNITKLICGDTHELEFTHSNDGRFALVILMAKEPTKADGE